MKKLVKLFIFLCVFCCNASYAKTKLEKIVLVNNKNAIRFIFFTKSKPNYLVKNNKNSLEIDFLNDNTDLKVINSFKNRNKNVKYEFKKFNSYSVFRYFKKNNGKVLKNVYLKPDKQNKFYRIIVDLETKPVNMLKTTKKEPILNKKQLSEKVENENYSFENLEELIENKIDVVENDKEKLDSLLSEILEFKILGQELVENRENDKNADLSNFINQIENMKKNDNHLEEENNIIRRNTFINCNKKYYTVVIDAGHGGKDPGTIGVKKSREKNINLIYAQSLKKALQKYRKIKVVLTRNDDTFYELSERIKIARDHSADLFISLHSDFSGNKKTRGLTVYTLSKKASDTRTAELANKENRNDIMVGMDLYNEYQETINTLVDLSRVDVLNESKLFANKLVNKFHNNELKTTELPHRSANFGVLLAPDFPSVLIELGFLSNAKDEKMLQSYAYRRDVTNTIAKAVSEYFKI